MKEILPVIMNTNFERLAVIDEYISIIWTTRYYAAGDFELCLPVNDRNMQLCKPDYFVMREDDENVGIIEDIRIQRTEDGVEMLIVSGRFLVSILARRIIATQTTVSGKISACIEQLITDNIINPTMEARKIQNFIIDSADISPTMKAQYTGKNLLETIADLCETYGIGLKVTLNQSNQFVFKLFVGKDRTYDQTENTWVIFSDKYDNLLSSDYEENYQQLTTAVLVAGEGQGLERKTAWMYDVYDPVGNNLVSDANVAAYDLASYSYSNGVYTARSTTSNGGLQIAAADIMTVGNVYILKYKFRKTSGTLKNIGGHNSSFTQISFTVDGKDAGTYSSSYALPDDNDVHEVVYVGIYNGDKTDKNLYIQPNRSNTNAITFEVTDLEIHLSQGTAGLSRHELYKDQRQIQSNDGEISEDEYMHLLEESGKESLTHYVAAFTGTVYFDNVKYKEDVNIGDLCVIENSRWGLYLNTRLVEVIESISETGEYSITPTFGV